LTNVQPEPLFSLILQTTLPRFAAKIKLSHAVSQEQIVMARPAKKAPPNLTPMLNGFCPILFHNRRNGGRTEYKLEFHQR
jgi:hypothetical protein